MKTAIQILDGMIEFIDSGHSEYSPMEDMMIKYSLEQAKERIQKETSNENNERYFACFYSSISDSGRHTSGGWGFVRNVFPNYSEILSLIKGKEGGAFIIIHSITEVQTKEDLLNFVGCNPIYNL